MKKKLQLLFTLLVILFVAGLSSCSKSPSNRSHIATGNIDSIIQIRVLLSSRESEVNLEHNKALKLLKPMLSHTSFHLAQDSSRAKTYHKLGTFYYGMKQFENAKSYLDTAINIQKHKTSSEALISIANSYYNRSLVFEDLFRYNEALADINLAIKITKKFPELKFTKGSYFSKAGNFYFAIGENNKALSYYEQAAQLIEPNSRKEAEFFTHFGKYFKTIKQYDKAIEQYDRAIAVYSKLPHSAFYSAPIIFNRFDLLMETSPYNQVKQEYQKYLSTFQDTTIRLKNYKRMGHSNLAYINIKNNDLDKANNNYKKVLALAKELTSGDHSIRIGRAYEGLGDVQFEKKHYDKAIDFYHEAIKSISIGFTSDNPFDLPNLQEHAILNENELERIMGFKAAAIVDKYKSTKSLVDLHAAFTTYQKLDALLVQIRQGYKAAMSRYNLVGRTIPYYELATQMALRLYERTQENKYLNAAYSFASKNKAVIMLDGLQDEKARFAGIPKNILQSEEDLKKEIYQLEGEIFDAGQSKDYNSDIVNALVKKRFDKTRAYETLIDQLEKEYPKYHQLKYATANSLDVNNLRNPLPNNTAVIEYFVGSDSIYIFSFTQKTELQYQAVNRTRKFSKACTNLRKMTEKDSLYSIADFSETSNYLYKLLLEQPIQKLNTEIDRLIIIPDHNLTQVSFETLMTATVDSTQNMEWTNALPYLIREYAISYSYSNQLIFDEPTNERIKNTGNNYIGFGLEYDDYTLNAITNLQELEELPQLSRGMGKLIYSDDEIIECAKIMNGTSYINTKANKPNFIKNAEKASILHLATHGFVVRKNPLNSGLIFTKQSKNDDFILKASDIYTLDLIADMAVLSACHSGNGRVEKGEGMRSLARAFNYAGCPNVTASLWAATDFSTKEIMVTYYKELKKGKAKDVSLRLAKLAYLDNCPFNKDALPRNWAHLVTIGNISPIVETTIN